MLLSKRVVAKRKCELSLVSIHERCVNIKRLLLKINSKWRQFSIRKTKRRGRNETTSSRLKV